MTPRTYILMSFFVGLALFGFSCTLPYYTDEAAVNELNNNAQNMDVAEYYHQRNKLETNKTYYMDAGIGLVIASGSVLSFQLFGRVRKWKDLFLMRTPSKKTIFITTNIAWILVPVSLMWYYTYRLGRGDYPPFADSGMVNIDNMMWLYYVLMLIPLNAFLMLTTFGAELPARLFVKASRYSFMAVAWEVLFGALLFVNFMVVFEFIIDGDHLSIPITLFFTYILLSLRAGKMAQY